MSEGSIPIEKAVPIIVVTWVLSLVTTLALVYFAPSIFPPTWHEVARFSGTNDEQTDMFDVPSMHWRIIWYVSSDEPQDARFSFSIPRRSSFRFREVTLDELYYGYEDGEEYLTGSGSCWIEVVADNVDDWFISIQAYY